MFQFLAGVLAFFYAVVPNYAVAIGLLTLTVMLVLSPLTLKMTRSMLAMQRLAPEIKRLQQQHKGDRQKLGEETMKLYREHGVNPAASCLPMLLQLPVFLVMYQVIRGLTHKPGNSEVFDPKYLDKGTDLYQALRGAGGEMESFGVDLARTAAGGHGGFLEALPFFVIVALVVGTQLFQMRQTTSRNTVQVNPQAQMMMKFTPAIFGVVSLSIPAGLNIYFLVSALFRIVQTEAMYRFDPALKEHVARHVRDVEAKAVDARDRKKDQAADPEGTVRPAGKGSPAGSDQGNGRGSSPKAGGADARAGGQKGGSRNGNRSRSKKKSKSRRGR